MSLLYRTFLRIPIFPKDNLQFWHLKTILEFLMRIIYETVMLDLFPQSFCSKICMIDDQEKAVLLVPPFVGELSFVREHSLFTYLPGFYG